MPASSSALVPDSLAISRVVPAFAAARLLELRHSDADDENSFFPASTCPVLSLHCDRQKHTAGKLSRSSMGWSAGAPPPQRGPRVWRVVYSK